MFIWCCIVSRCRKKGIVTTNKGWVLTFRMLVLLQRVKKLPPIWKYESATASALVT